VAKRDLPAGYLIRRGIGSFDVRGVAVNIKDQPDHVPIGLLQSTKVTKNIGAGEMVTFDRAIVPESVALKCWEKVVGI
jgi:predicted homoserine dehydrogenase-like protein